MDDRYMDGWMIRKEMDGMTYGCKTQQIPFIIWAWHGIDISNRIMEHSKCTVQHECCATNYFWTGRNWNETENRNITTDVHG